MQLYQAWKDKLAAESKIKAGAVQRVSWCAGVRVCVRASGVCIPVCVCVCARASAYMRVYHYV